MQILKAIGLLDGVSGRRVVGMDEAAVYPTRCANAGRLHLRELLMRRATG